MTWLGLATLAGLGAFHGINPGMGWLFAVALGLQERSARAVVGALPAIAAGHATAVFAVAGLVVVLRSVVATRVVAVVGGLVVVAFGLYRALSRRHFRWVGMRVSRWDLVSWSFLMSSVHGAGLMLVPVLVTDRTFHPSGGHDGPLAALAGQGVFAALWQGVSAVAVHTAAMMATAGVVAVAVYRVVGLAVLRSAWLNFDRVWAFALIASGAATVAVAW